MKNLLFFLVLLCVSFNLFSQTESFDSGVFPPTTPFSITTPISGNGMAFSGDLQWYRSDDAIVNGTFQNSGLDNGYGGTGNCVVMNSEKWCCGWDIDMTLNPVDLSGYSAPRMKFFIKHKDGDEELLIQASTGGAFTTLLTIQQNYADWSPIFVDLSAYAGLSNVQIRFHGQEGPSDNSYATNVGIDEILIEEQLAMTYVSSTTSQTGCNMYQNGIDQPLMRIEVVTQGSLSPLNLSDIILNTNGTTIPSDISAEKIYYTGTSNQFNTSNLFGSSVSTGTYTISGSFTLEEGTNYFWLAYDIPITATLGNNFDAECTELIIDATSQYPTITAPIGSLTLNNSNVFSVTNLNDSGTGSLRGALSAANSYGCDAIVDARGVQGDILFNSHFTINSTHHITVIGPGASILSIDGTNNSIWGFTHSGPGLLTIEGLKFQNFNGNKALYCNNTETEIKYCHFYNNTAGATYFPDGHVEIWNTTFESNSTTSSGGAIYNPGCNLGLHNCTFYNNTAGNAGGAINASGPTTIENCTFTENTANNVSYNGGAIKIGDALIVYNTTFNNNHAPGTGKDVSGSIEMYYSHISQPAGATITGSNNVSGVIVDMDTLADYGGSVPTCALLVTSTDLINAGDNSTALPKDQRDFCRLDIPDIGAFEFNADAPANVTVSIFASSTEICDGTPVTFTASYANAGASPTIHWTLNGCVVQSGASTTYINSTIANNDFIGFILETDNPSTCEIPEFVYSEEIVITVAGPYSYVTNETICDGETYDFQGNSHTTTGTYPFNYTSIYGCDSIYTLNLTVNPVNAESYAVSSCDSLVSPSSLYTWYSTGVYKDTLPNIFGCDSILTIDVTINNSNSGSENISACGTYTWSANGQTYTSDGSYTAVIPNSYGCDSIATLNLTFYSITASINILNDATCGFDNGSAEAIVSGGIPPYTYNWSNGDTTSVADSLSAGMHSVQITDDNGCYTMVYFTVNSTGGPVITFNSLTDILCNGENTGTIDISVTGGVQPYTIQWSNGATSASISGLTAGNYQVMVSDDNGCMASFDTIIIQPDLLEAAFTLTNPACLASDGEISVVVTGGVTNYIYNWSSGGTTNIITGLSAGTYSLTITDNNSCVLIDSVALTSTGGPVITLDSIQSVGCGSFSGAIYVSVTGGTTPYASYEWSNGSTFEDLIDVVPGIYYLTVTDGSGCIALFSHEIIAIEPLEQPICVVMVDSATGMNLVVWEKVQPFLIDHYNIYRESWYAGQYDFIASVPYDDMSEYVDPTANPTTRSWRYKISAVDFCAQESPLSEHHKTIHLTINEGLGQTYNLIWDHYEGLPYFTYYIHRYMNSTDWVLIDSLPSNLTSYTDDPGTMGGLLYKISINTPNACIPTSTVKLNGGPYSHSVSNLEDNGIAVGIINKNTDMHTVIFPNPNTGEFTVNSNNSINYIEVLNINGQLIEKIETGKNIFNVKLT